MLDNRDKAIFLKHHICNDCCNNKISERKKINYIFGVSCV